MEVQLLDTRAEWEEAVGTLPVSFAQSWEWGEMQKAIGNSVYRVATNECVVTLSVLSLGFGQYVLFGAQGPVCSKEMTIDEQWVKNFTHSSVIQKIIKENHVIALRIEPPVHVQTSNQLKRVIDVSPAVTNILDLAASTDELLAAMKQKTRYNIRLAQKQGVEISFFSDDTHWEQLTEEWWKLVLETSERHGIGHHQKEYYAHMLSSLGNAGMLEAAQARHEGDILAMTLNCRYRDTYTYVHGAATHHKKKLMASYAIQWAAIQRAKDQGYHWYDLYGIAPEDNAQHPLAGVTRFKRGFGGKTLERPGTFEYGVSPMYSLYSVYRKLKRSQ